MSPALIALSFVAVIFLGTVAFALITTRRISSSPEQFIVGGRSFGTLLLWILMAGEIYTSFTFLGAAGWAYGRGAPALYILAYGTVGYIVGYFLLPGLWRLGKDHGLLTAPDLYLLRYKNMPLSTIMAVVQALLLIPYITLQLGGLQKLLTIAGYGHVNSTVAVVIGFLLVTIFVFSAGLHGTAWASVIKDTLVLAAVLFAGIAIPMHFFGSVPAMMDRLLATHPHWLTLKHGTATQGEVWFVSTVLLTGIGFFSGPQNMAATFSARHGDAIRRNMVFLPLYQLILLFVFFAGFAALLVVPGSKDPDLSFMLLLQKHYPSWIVGAIAGAGTLAALLPASALLLCAASLISKNVLGDALNIATADRARTNATRVLIVVFALLAMTLWLAISAQTLVQILLYYYNGITQFLPGYIFALVWRDRVSARGIIAGLVTGFGLALYFILTGQLAVFGLNTGFVALASNAIVCIAVSWLFSKNWGSPRPQPNVTEHKDRMDDFATKRFEQPDETATFEKGRFDTIAIGGMTLGLATYEPGWKWSEHIGSQSGKKWCSTEHVGVVLSGVAAVSFPDGTVKEMRKGDAFHITGEHDSWVIGDEPYVSLHLVGAKEYKP